MLVPLVQCFGMASTGNIPILPVLVLARTCCACTSCTVFWHGQPGQCTYLARVRDLLDRAMILVFGLARCTCRATHTVFDMDSLSIWHGSLGDAPIARWFEIVRCTCTRRDSHAVLTNGCELLVIRIGNSPKCTTATVTELPVFYNTTVQYNQYTNGLWYWV